MRKQISASIAVLIMVMAANFPISAQQQLNEICVNGVCPVTAFGAIGSGYTATATLNATNSFTLNTNPDFAAFQPVNMAHASETASRVSEVSDVTVTPQSYSMANGQPTGTVEFAGCNSAGTNANDTNAACTSSYKACIVSVDPVSGWSVPTCNSSGGTNGPTFLSSADNIKVCFKTARGARGYIYYGCKDSKNTNPANCTATYWKDIPAMSGGSECFIDEGNHWGADEVFGTTMQPGGAHEDLVTTISTLASLSGTFAASAGVTGTRVIHHNDAAGINAAIAAVCSGGTVNVPFTAAGGARTYEAGQPITLNNCNGVKVLSPLLMSVGGGFNITLRYTMGSGNWLFDMPKATSNRIEGFRITGSSDPSVVFSMDNRSVSTGSYDPMAIEIVHNQVLVNSGFEVATGQLGGTGNSGQMMKVLSNQFIGSTVADIYISNPDTLNTRIEDNTLGQNGSPPDYGIWFDSAGSAIGLNNDCEYAKFACVRNTNVLGSGNGSLTLLTQTSEFAPFFYYENISSGNSNGPDIKISSARIQDTPVANGYVIVKAKNGGLTLEESNVCLGDSFQCRIDIGIGTARFPNWHKSIFRNNTYNKVLSPVGGGGYYATIDGAPITDDTGGSNFLPTYEEDGDKIVDALGATYKQIRHVVHGENLMLDQGVLGLSGGNPPTVSSCGTSPTNPASPDSNTDGSFATGTGSPTACTMTFNTAMQTGFVRKPRCFFQDNTASPVTISDAPTAAPTATDVLTLSAAANNHVIKYHCDWTN